MGYTSWTDSDWKTYSTTTSTKTADAIFTQNKLHPDMNPLNSGVRESRDSDLHPESNAIIIALDVTGSMGIIAERMVKEGLGVLFNEILDRQPVQHPQIMVMGMGDAEAGDSSPFQIGQFESDIKVADWLEKIHLEGHGGGNNSESYDLPLYYAAYHTSIDCFEKRGKKGYLFTIGDEAPREVTRSHIVKSLIGDTIQSDIPLDKLLEDVGAMYNYYHIVVMQGSYASRHPGVVKEWSKYYGQFAVPLSDYTKLSELIVSLIQFNEGTDKDTIVKSWSGDTSIVISNSLSNITDLAKPSASDSGVVRL